MFMSEESTQYNPNEAEEAEVNPELELPPVVTRTRSGRRVRTPAALLDSEVPSLVKTPSRRTRKSAIQKLPENKTGNHNTEPNTTILAVKQMIESREYAYVTPAVFSRAATFVFTSLLCSQRPWSNPMAYQMIHATRRKTMPAQY